MAKLAKADWPQLKKLSLNNVSFGSGDEPEGASPLMVALQQKLKLPMKIED